MIVSAAWILPALLGALDAVGQNAIWGGDFDVRAVLFTSIDWLLYAAITPFVFVLSRRLPLSGEQLKRNAAWHALFAFLFCFVWAGLGTILKVLLQQKLDGGAVRSYASWVLTTFPFGVAVYLCEVGVEHAIRYFVDVRDRDVRLARLSDQLSSARLAALQARLNPHFLFNSLNTIAVLVRDNDTRAATRVVEQLSDVLRTTLGRSHDSEVALDDELSLVRQYLAVEEARFSDRLRPEIDVDPSLLSAAVPSFALQHLVENAIRHGIARRSDAGHIVVRARRDGDVLELSVSDDGPGIEAGAEQTEGRGLANTRERLATLYGGRASLRVERAKQGTTATLRLPYRELALETSLARG